jgi:hypothetical protein
LEALQLVGLRPQQLAVFSRIRTLPIPAAAAAQEAAMKHSETAGDHAMVPKETLC